MTMPAPVEAIIGLGLEVKGQAWDQLHNRLDGHVKDWNTVESTVNRIGSHVEGLSTRLMQLGGAVGLGAVINDFVQLENQVNRTALAVGNVTGTSAGYRGLGQQMLGAGAATGFYGGQLAQSIEQLQTRAGGTYLAGPGHAAGVARALGAFGGAYSVDPTQLAQQIGGLELFQRQNPGSTPLLLQQMAAQAAHAGMAGQTGLFTQNVSSLTQSLIAAHPAAAGPGANIRVGAMYGAAQLVNPAFRDAGVFGQGLSGIDSAVTGAYQNPRLQAVMQMAGIGYWQQRGGLAGPHGPEIAHKLLAWSAAQYGQGSVAQDMFLRSNFGGNVSADLLQSLASGKGTAAQRSITDSATNPSALAAAASAIHLRSEQYQTTPGAAAQRGRDTLERDVYGLFGNAGLDVMNWVGSHPVESIAGAYGLRRLIPFAGRRLGGAAFRRAQGFAAQQAARAFAGASTTDVAAGAGESALLRLAGGADTVAPDAFMGGAFSSATDAAGAGGLRILGMGAGAFAGSLAGNVALTYATMMAFPDSAGDANNRAGMRSGLRHSRGAIEQGIVASLAKRYGNDWWTKAPALAAMSKLAHQRSGDPHTRRIIQKQLRDAIARQAGHVARAGREGPLGDAFSTLLGGVPGIGAGLSGFFDLGAQMYTKGHPGHDAGGDLLHLLGHHAPSGAAVASASATKFDHSVDKFGRIINQMGLGPRVGGASYMGGSGPGMLNAGGLAGPTDQFGASMILARAIGGGGGGAGGGGGVGALQVAALGLGAGGGGGTASGGPARYRSAANAAGSKYGIHPGILMAIAEIESGFGAAAGSRPGGSSSAGALGPMQFEPGTWSQYGHGSVYDVENAMMAAAKLLAARGGMRHIRKAIYAYNHSWAYVDDVLRRARKYGYNPGGGHHAVGQTSKTAAGGGASGGSAGDALAAALAWQSGGGGGGGAAGGGAGGGGAPHVTVNVDGRRIEHYQALTRGAV